MEKTGFIEKLRYDFNTAANLEVYLPRLKNWYRATGNDFRSFDGARRVNGEEYIGPLYAYGTNEQTPFTNTSQLTSSEILNDRKLISKKRGI